MNFISVVLILFLIIDPLGSVAAFNRLLKPFTPKKRLWILTREMCIALIFMFVFYFFGDWLLDALGISEIAVRISSGLILFIAAIKILFPQLGGELRKGLKADNDLLIIPLAIPLVAGPSLLATLMLFANINAIDPYMFPAMLTAWALSFVVLALAPILHRFLKDSGLIAAEKVMGMVLILLAIQRILEGVKLFIVSYPL